MIEWLQFQLSLISVQSHCRGRISKQKFWSQVMDPPAVSFNFQRVTIRSSPVGGSCWLLQLTRSQKDAKFGVARREKASGNRGTLSEGLSVAEFFLPGNFNLPETSREVDDWITVKFSYLAHCPVNLHMIMIRRSLSQDLSNSSSFPESSSRGRQVNRLSRSGVVGRSRTNSALRSEL